MQKNNLTKKEEELKKLLRPEIKSISPYKAEKDDFEVKIRLSGNESPFDLPQKIKAEFKEKFDQHQINRYPEIYSESLQKKLALYLSKKLNKKITKEEILLANGSDEILDILVRTFIEPEDVLLSQRPTFSMYKFFTEINCGQYEDILLNDNFSFEKLKEKIDTLKPKLIILCSPNNPTGELIDKELILKTAEYFNGAIIIDEAYADFSQTTLMTEVKNNSNLAVLRTFSKAFGLAGIRFGYLYGNPVVVEELKKVLKPYNLNSLTEMMAALILDNEDVITERIEFIKKERKKIYQSLSKYQKWETYSSEANFIYLEGEKTKKFKSILNQKQVKVRSYQDPAALRITIGTEAENQVVLKAFEEFKASN